MATKKYCVCDSCEVCPERIDTAWLDFETVFKDFFKTHWENELTMDDFTRLFFAFEKFQEKARP